LTDAEIILWSRLRRARQIGVRFRRQHPIGPYIADFACIAAKLVIEVDGACHGAPSERAYDGVRDRYMGERGWQVLRIDNHNVYTNLERARTIQGGRRHGAARRTAV